MTSPQLEAGSANPAAEQRRTILLCLGLTTAVLALYWPVKDHGFINFDDPDYVSSNPLTQAGLTAAGFRWAFTSFYASNWHPLTWLSHMLDCQLYGLRPSGHHLTNLGLHLANTLLLFLLLQKLTRAPWRSSFVAALFALHPLHVESVAWIAERKDVLSAFFGLLSLWAYTRWVEEAQLRQRATQGFDPGPRGGLNQPTGQAGLLRGHRVRAAVFYGLSLILFACGLMSKPMLVTWPAVMLLLDYWPLERLQLPLNAAQLRKLGALVVEKIPFLGLSVALSIVVFLAQKGSGAVVELGTHPLDARLANAVVSYVRYLAKAIWPANLSPFYPYQHWDWTSWPTLSGVALVLGLTGLVLVRAKAKPYLLVGWFWFLGTLVPVIGLVQVGAQAMADRYTYLPLIGIFLAATWTTAEWWAVLRPPTGVHAVACALPLVACCVLTSLQLRHWRDTKTLFQHAATVTPDNYIAHAILANALVSEGQLEEAIQECRAALRISPRYPEAHHTLANILRSQGKYDEAISECGVTLEISPRHQEAHYLLGNILEIQGRYDEAIASYRAALAANSSYLDAYDGLASALTKKRAYVEAETSCREALKLAPEHLPALFCLASCLHSQGKFEDAIQYYQRLIALAPSLFAPHRYLANALAARGKTAEALAELVLAAKIQPDDVETHNALGELLFHEGHLDDALARFNEAIQLQPTNFTANYQLALLHQRRNEMKEAVACFHHALNSATNSPALLNNLAWILAANPDPAVRNGLEAVTLAKRACALTGYQQAVLVGTLAAAYAEAGRFPDAVRTGEKARDLAVAAGETEVAETNRKLLEFYRANQPYHEALPPPR